MMMERGQTFEKREVNSTNLDEAIKGDKVNYLVKTLDRLGRLPPEFDKKPLLDLLKHENDKVRCLSIKNLAKLEELSLITTFVKSAKNDPSSNVRREAVSAIGRLRNPITKNILFSYLKDPDPEVILQAIRGLLVFKNEVDVRDALLKLKDHPNEIIQDIIQKEFRSEEDELGERNHQLSPESVHLTFTSPPYYNARDYSIYRSYKEYLDFLEEVFKETYRITKEGRFFILNTSPIIIPRVGRQYSSKRYPIPFDIHSLLTQMGWEFIDDIIWLKPEASAKNRNAGFLQHRKPLAYKPNPCTEYVMVYRKKTDRLIDWNIRQYDNKTVEDSKINGDFESGNVWRIDPVFDKTHSAVFPLELCNKIIKFYSYKGDLVFDPFAGSGTLGKAAINLERYFFLTEKENKYFERIKENISQLKISSDYVECKPRFLNLEGFRESTLK